MGERGRERGGGRKGLKTDKQDVATHSTDRHSLVKFGAIHKHGLKSDQYDCRFPVACARLESGLAEREATSMGLSWIANGQGA